MLGPGLHSPPLVASQHPIDGGSGHHAAHLSLIALLDLRHRDELASLSLLVARSQQRLLLGCGEVLMMESAFGSPLGGGQSAPQKI